MRRSHGPVASSLAMTLACLSACTTYSPARPSDLQANREVRATFAEARDIRVRYPHADSALTLNTSRVEGRLSGGSAGSGDTVELQMHDPNDYARTGATRFVMDSSTTMQARHVSAGKTALLVLGIGAVAVGALAIAVSDTCMAFCTNP